MTQRFFSKRLTRSRKLLKDLEWTWRWPGVPRRYVTFRKILNYYRAQVSWLLAREEVGSRPYQLTLELTNTCNLRCPQCPTGQGKLGRKASMMSLSDLERVLDELAPYAFMMDIHNWGEPLLHRDVYDAIRLCEQHRIMTIMCTNFNVPFDADKAEGLVRSGLSVLGVSMDGPDQQSYETYRVRGRLDLALGNVRLVQEAKKRLGASNPRVIWTYLVFRFNEHLVEETRAVAERHGMAFSASKGISDDPEWCTTEIYLHPIDDMARRGPSCRWLYSMAVVNADLGISPCCAFEAFHSEDDFGQVREGTFGQVWNGPRYRAARRLFQGLNDESRRPLEPIVCKRCRVYASRKEALDAGRR